MLTKEQLEWARTVIPEQIARDLLSVQPMSPDVFKKLQDDPLANELLNRFVQRNTTPK